MQDPSLYSQIRAQVHPQFPEQEHLRCPRCDSTNTKFCYFNNYNLSQPRHFCKSCRRYWTKGGALRNVPVGGGSRKKSKRTSGVAVAVSKTTATPPPASADKSEDRNAAAAATEAIPPEIQGDNSTGRFGNSIEAGDSLCSLLGPSPGHFGHYLDGLGLTRPNLAHFSDPGPGQNVDPLALDSAGGNGNSDGFLGIHLGTDGGDSDCWGGASSAWPDLAIYPPGRTFH